MSRKWEIKKIKRTEPYRYLVILLDDEGKHLPQGHERYASEQRALGRAEFLAKIGQRCDVLVDVAASYGVEE